jgi:hypothetical protein
MFAARAC